MKEQIIVDGVLYIHAARFNEYVDYCVSLEKALKSIVSGGEWLADIYANQDNNCVEMAWAYAKDSYRIASEVLPKK